MGDGNYDPETNIAYWGTGNGGPWMGDQRPGDNLYVASTVAINVATGRSSDTSSINPNESFDWDEVSPPLLIDFRRGGQTSSGLINASRSGTLWFERTKNGPIRFVEGKPYVNQTVFKSLDPKTGSLSTTRRRSRAQARKPLIARRSTAARTGRPPRITRARG